MTDGTRPPLHVLLVEDNDWDAQMVLEAFAAGSPQTRVERAIDGVAAMERLRRPASARDPRPDLVLLDLNLPRRNGREVLHDMKQDPALRVVPVVVLTTSRAPNDVDLAYGEHANSYVVKPFDPKEYPAFVKALEEYWHGWNTPAP